MEERESNQEERSVCGAEKEPHCTGAERAFFPQVGRVGTI